MTPENLALEPKLLEQVGKLAQEEGKTADQLASERLIHECPTCVQYS
jgi:hypothetical protein